MSDDHIVAILWIPESPFPFPEMIFLTDVMTRHVDFFIPPMIIDYVVPIKLPRMDNDTFT